jgi:hypothetical protein
MNDPKNIYGNYEKPSYQRAMRLVKPFFLKERIENFVNTSTSQD